MIDTMSSLSSDIGNLGLGGSQESSTTFEEIEGIAEQRLVGVSGSSESVIYTSQDSHQKKHKKINVRKKPINWRKRYSLACELLEYFVPTTGKKKEYYMRLIQYLKVGKGLFNFIEVYFALKSPSLSNKTFKMSGLLYSFTFLLFAF